MSSECGLVKTPYIRRQVVRLQENKDNGSWEIMCKPENCNGQNGKPRWSNLALPLLQKPEDWAPRPKTPKRQKMGRQDVIESSDEDEDKVVNNEIVSPPLAAAATRRRWRRRHRRRRRPRRAAAAAEPTGRRRRHAWAIVMPSAMWILMQN